MQTLILPGYSAKNKDWAEETQKQLSPTLEAKVIYWPHWEDENTKSDWQKEAEKIINHPDPKINLLAKSIGTLVAMLVLEKAPDKVNKLILCGVPLYDFLEGDPLHYKVLKKFPVEKLFCIQNEKDNHGSFEDVQKFLKAINPKTQVISKPREDHEYSYSEDFSIFFKTNN